ncbi:MAG: hypothetical protein M1818_007151 [Claussenomyces sp. TS43310]|nr:MAG: hypothetical protein M1818_007151 [Claussenomyces sp. TS43310]
MWLPTSAAVFWLATFAFNVYAADSDSSDVKRIPLRTHTLVQPYLDSDMLSRWWEFGGDTVVRADKYVRLTPDRPSREGWVFSRVPLTATNWEIEVEFKIYGKGNLHGDGMAMWLTRQRSQPGTVFGSTDNFEGLGIFFDTYKNNRPGTVFPYVMAMVGDGMTPYDKNNDGKANEYAGCSARGIRGASVPTKARLTYFQDKSLKLELQYKAEDQWILCFEKEDPPTLPSAAYLGFSAETGELSDNHEIISVQANNLYSSGTGGARPGNAGTSRQREGRGRRTTPPKKRGGGWLWFLFKIIIFAGVCVAGYVGYTAWRMQNKRSHRF